MRLGIFLPESTFSADSVTVFVQPLRAVACTDICEHVKKPQLHTEILHTLVGMGSAALRLLWFSPVKANRTSRKGLIKAVLREIERGREMGERGEETRERG